MVKETIKVYDDKCTFFMDNHSLHCLRYGEKWRDFVGDGAVLQLFLHTVDLIKENQKLHDQITQMENERLEIDKLASKIVKVGQ